MRLGALYGTSFDQFSACGKVYETHQSMYQDILEIRLINDPGCIGPSGSSWPRGVQLKADNAHSQSITEHISLKTHLHREEDLCH